MVLCADMHGCHADGHQCSCADGFVVIDGVCTPLASYAEGTPWVPETEEADPPALDQPLMIEVGEDTAWFQ